MPRLTAGAALCGSSATARSRTRIAASTSPNSRSAAPKLPRVDGILGLELQSRAVGGHRLGRVTGALQGDAQRDPGIVRGGVFSDRASIRVRGLARALQGLQHLTEAELVAAIVWGGERGLLNRAKRRIRPPLLQVQETAAKQRNVVAWVRRQKLRVQAPCLRQIAGAMLLGGCVQKVVDGRDGGSSRPWVGRPHAAECAYTTVPDRIIGCAGARATSSTGEAWIWG